MAGKYFPLGNTDDNKAVKIIRILFGLACLGMAAWWTSFNLRNSEREWSLWLTIIFLTGFGLYLVWAGLGKATRFILIEKDRIFIKKNSLLPVVKMVSGDISKIELLPLSIVFQTNPKGKFMLRFGTVNYETNEKIVDEVIAFAEENNIQYEVKEEELGSGY